jgi:outer membrane receptor protein involved in Fe transport
MAFALAVLIAATVSPRAGEADLELPERLLLAQAAEELPREGEPAKPVDAADAEEPASQSEVQDAPAGIEVINVRTRAAGALEADVPSSLTVFDAATLEALGAEDISDLARVTPNVNIVQPGSTQATFFVRGIGLSDFSSNAAGAVTIFQDDVAIDPPAIQTGQLYDVEAVDVMRGPQGSGAFRNASAGAIRVRSRRPTGNYGAQLRASIGRYDADKSKGARDALTQDYEGGVEMPLVQDWLSSRFAFRLREADPYKRNGCGYALPLNNRLPARDNSTFPPTGFPITTPGVSQCGEVDAGNLPPGQVSRIPFGLPRWVNDVHDWAARGTFSLSPPDSDSETAFFLNAHGSRLAQDSVLGQAIGTAPIRGATDTTIRFAGNQSPGGYIDRDVEEEFIELCGDLNGNPTITNCANRYATPTIVKRLAQNRPLDKRPYRGDYNHVGNTTRDAWGGFVSGEGPVFADVKLFGLASYDGYERFQDVDSDFTPVTLFETAQFDEGWQTYEELKLSGELEEEPVEWNVGGYYLREELDNDGTVFVNIDHQSDLNTRRTYTQIIDSYGLWGELGWDFADDFTLQAGVRYNWERKQFDYTKRGGNPPGTVRAREEEAWGTPTGQIILTYHYDAEKLAYARYTRGFKAGHFNALASQTGAETASGTGTFNVEPADEEYNDAWEAGLRGTWLGGRVRLSGAFFYYRYENYQVFQFTDSAFGSGEPPTLEIVNAPQAENYGVELEGGVQPLEGWTPRVLSGLRLTANFGWLHGEYIDFTTFRRFSVPTNPNPFSVALDYSGKFLQNAPEYKVSGTVEWTFDLERFGYLIPRYDVNWSDDVFFDTNEGRGSLDPSDPRKAALPKFAIGQEAYFLHNIRLAYRAPSGNVELAAWVRNVEDKVYKTYAFDVSRFTNLTINYPGEPRTIGLDFIFTF